MIPNLAFLTGSYNWISHFIYFEKYLTIGKDIRKQCKDYKDYKFHVYTKCFIIMSNFDLYSALMAIKQYFFRFFFRVPNILWHAEGWVFETQS